MGLVAEFKSGIFPIYAQWMAWIACFVLGSLGAFNMVYFQDFAWTGLIAIILGFVAFLMEVPWVGKALPTKANSVYEDIGFRVAFYFVLTSLAVIAGVLETNLYFIPTGLLGATMLLYVVALFRKQPLERSCISNGVETAALVTGLGV